MPQLLPDVPEEEVLGAPLPAGTARRGPPPSSIPRWVPWLIAGILLLSIVWGLFVIAP